MLQTSATNDAVVGLMRRGLAQFMSSITSFFPPLLFSITSFDLHVFTQVLLLSLNSLVALDTPHFARAAMLKSLSRVSGLALALISSQNFAATPFGGIHIIAVVFKCDIKDPSFCSKGYQHKCKTTFPSDVSISCVQSRVECRAVSV